MKTQGKACGRSKQGHRRDTRTAVPQGRRLRKKNQQRKQEEKDSRDKTAVHSEASDRGRLKELRLEDEMLHIDKKGRKGGEKKGVRGRQRKKKEEGLNRSRKDGSKEALATRK